MEGEKRIMPCLMKSNSNGTFFETYVLKLQIVLTLFVLSLSLCRRTYDNV